MITYARGPLERARLLGHDIQEAMMANRGKRRLEF